MELSLQLSDPSPALRKAEELKAHRKALVNEISRLEHEHATQKALCEVTPDQVRALVRSLADELASAERPRLKGVLQSVVECVLLDPITLECRVRYRIQWSVP